jgi:hypothetical protein
MSAMRAVRPALVLALAFTAASCATFSSKTLPMIKQLPPRDAAKPSVRVSLSYENYPYFGQRAKDSPKRTRRFEEEMEQALRQSGYLSSVATDTADPDLVIHAQLRDSTDIKTDYGWMFLETIGLWPSVYHGKYSLRLTATSPRLTTDWDLHLVTGFTTWGHILLLPLMPFTYETAVAHRVRTNLFRNVCLQLEQQGVLDAATAGDSKAVNH